MLPLEPQHATHSAQLSRLQRSSQVFQLDLVGHVHFHSTGRPSALDFDPTWPWCGEHRGLGAGQSTASL